MDRYDKLIEPMIRCEFKDAQQFQSSIELICILIRKAKFSEESFDYLEGLFEFLKWQEKSVIAEAIINFEKDTRLYNNEEKQKKFLNLCTNIVSNLYAQNCSR